MNKEQILKDLDEVIADLEKDYNGQCDHANWYNNNVPGVGQTSAYMPLPPIPAVLPKLTALREKIAADVTAS